MSRPTRPGDSAKPFPRAATSTLASAINIAAASWSNSRSAPAGLHADVAMGQPGLAHFLGDRGAGAVGIGAVEGAQVAAVAVVHVVEASGHFERALVEQLLQPGGRLLALDRLRRT